MQETGSAWQQRTASLQGAVGPHDLFMVFHGSDGNQALFDFDYWPVAEQ